MVEAQLSRCRIRAPLARRCASRRCKTLGAFISRVVFRRSQASPIGSSFDALSVDRCQLETDAAGSDLGEQFLNKPFGLVVSTFAELMMSDAPFCVDDIKGRPGLVIECAPNRIVVIDRDREAHVHVLCSPANVVDVFLECELRCMHANHNQPLVFIFVGPSADVGKMAKPVDAGIGPKIDQDHFAAQSGRYQRW